MSLELKRFTPLESLKAENTTMCNMSEDKLSPVQLWTNYTKHNAKTWLGVWTRLDLLSGSVECFESIRNIQLINETRMHHQNTFIYSDDRRIDKGPLNGPWEYDRERDCDEEGLCHPSSRSSGLNARAFFLANGGGVWTIMEAKNGAVFFNEMFFPCGEKRLSCGVFYNREGNAERISFIREDTRGTPSTYWSRETDRKASIHDVPGSFTGTERTLSVQLLQTVTTGCQWNRNYWLRETRAEEEGNTVVYLPDRVMMAFPPRVDSNRPFHFKTFCYYTEGNDNEVREQSLYYENGRFSYFKQGIYYHGN